MKPTHIRIWCIAFAGTLCVSPALAQMDPVFTYQGQLKEEGHPYSGTTYLEFTLWDTPELGNQIGGPFWTSDGVNVVNGLFTVPVDAMAFGPTAFNGEPRWLQIVVTDWNYFERVELSPRQPITPAPYALYAFDGAGDSGSSLWSADGNNIYYDAGGVGIGTASPLHPLHASASGGYSIYGENDAVMGRGVGGEGTATEGSSVGVEGRALSTSGTGVSGYASSRTGTVFGVAGSMRSPDGAAIYGHNFAAEGGIAIHGWCARSDSFAGYFEGAPSYFSHNVGIGTTTPGSTLTANGVIESEVGGFKFPDGTIQTTAGGGGGTTLWSQDPNDNITYNDGFVGIWLIGAPTEALDVGGTVKMTGLQLGTAATAGHVLTTDADGIGTWQTAGGGGDSLWQVGESCIFYNDGDVGIGLEEYMWPVAKLEVGGTVKMDGLQLGEFATPGHVLTADANGVGTWQPGGGGFWSPTAAGINYQSGSVGIGTSGTVGDRLFVYGTGTRAIRARNGATTGTTYGVYGQADSTSGRAVYGTATAGSGQAVGVFGETASPDGYGVWGYNNADGLADRAIGVYGSSNGGRGVGVKGYASGSGGSALWGSARRRFRARLVGGGDGRVGRDFRRRGVRLQPKRLWRLRLQRSRVRQCDRHCRRDRQPNRFWRLLQRSGLLQRRRRHRYDDDQLETHRQRDGRVHHERIQIPRWQRSDFSGNWWRLVVVADEWHRNLLQRK